MNIVSESKTRKRSEPSATTGTSATHLSTSTKAAKASEPSKDPKNVVENSESSTKPKNVIQKIGSRDNRMMEITLNDRLGKKIKVKCNSEDTVGELKLLVGAMMGMRSEKLRFQKFYTVFKDHITLADYEVVDGMNLELYYN